MQKNTLIQYVMQFYIFIIHFSFQEGVNGIVSYGFLKAIYLSLTSVNVLASI